MLYDIILAQPKTQADLVTASEQITSESDATDITQKKIAALYVTLSGKSSVQNAMKQVPIVLELEWLCIYEIKAPIVKALASYPKSKLSTLCRKWQENCSQFEFEGWEEESVMRALVRLRERCKSAERSKMRTFLVISE